VKQPLIVPPAIKEEPKPPALSKALVPVAPSPRAAAMPPPGGLPPPELLLTKGPPAAPPLAPSAAQQAAKQAADRQAAGMASPQPQPAGLGFVSVDELADEIENHHDSDALRGQIAELREKKIDLKKFCSTVRQLCGAQVLLDTVKGLQTKQKAKQALKERAKAAAESGANGAVKQPLIVPPAIKEEPKPPALSKALVPVAPSPRAAAMPPPGGLPPPELLLTKGPPAAPPLAPSAAQQAAKQAADRQAASSSGLQEGSKTLVHALLCQSKNCTLDGCNATKALLQRVKEHTSS